jgi:holin-like protein
MLPAITALLAFQLIGEALAFGLKLPVPGPVIGMALLLAAIAVRPALLDALRPTSSTLLSHLSLLFVPAGVGVMVHGQRLADEGVAIVVALLVSTVLALAATALTVRALLRDDGAAGAAAPGSEPGARSATAPPGESHE